MTGSRALPGGMLDPPANCGGQHPRQHAQSLGHAAPTNANGADPVVRCPWSASGRCVQAVDESGQVGGQSIRLLP